ncbi:peptidoglycan-binding protein [bacterium]|nr:peptidoglycan-binding protein [bacterium]
MASRQLVTIQRQLAKLGYDPGLADGIMGRRTQAAVKSFQLDNGLLVDCIPGPRTRLALQLAIETLNTPSPEAVPLPRRTRTQIRRDRRFSGGTLLDALQRNGTQLELSRGVVHLIGVRGWKDSVAVENKFDEYNDTIVVVTSNGKSSRAYRYTASVDPGRLNEPNPRGVAHLVEGSYLYQIGLHRGRETALVQAGEVRVRRYFDEGAEPFEPYEESGWFGINIHRGGTSRNVGSWSAGCQVVHGSEWTRFLGHVQRAANQGQKQFLYHLIEGDHLSQLLRG